MYKRGHNQVSSFGVGGTNGHAIFWGKQEEGKVDLKSKVIKKINESVPQITVDGSDPAIWDVVGMPDPKGKANDRYDVNIEPDGTVLWDKIEEDEKEPLGDFFAVTGNFNDWTEERMAEGDVPGLHYQEIEVPASGVLQFRFCIEGDTEKSFGPAFKNCSKKTVPIIGPEADVTTFWEVSAPPSSGIRVELLAPPGCSVPTVT